MSILSIASKGIQNILKTAVSKVSAQFAKLKKLPLMIADITKKSAKKGISYVFGKPQSLKDYVLVGDNYVAKKFILTVFIVLCVVVFGLIFFVIPFLQKTFFTQEIIINSAEYHSASGNVRVVATSGGLLYAGSMADGVIIGSGTLYENGSIVYVGEFSDNMYNGSGKLYQNGFLVYSGSFANNKYEGEGEEYYPRSTAIKAKGNYSAGLLSGEGTTYTEKGTIIYSGSFSGGKYNGKGTLYKDGKLKYAGDFIDNIFDGKGTLYSETTKKVVYSGDFKNGIYQGEGESFENGKLRYKGSFSNALYNGTGQLYNDDGSSLKGEFINGTAIGNAELYNSGNVMIYTGPVINGEINLTSFISAEKEQVNSSFTAKCTEKVVDNTTLLYYSELNVGFIFESEDKVDRIIVTGNQTVFDTVNGMLISDLKEKHEDKLYNEYFYPITSHEKKIMSYLGIDASPQMYCGKFILDDVFIKIYSAVTSDSILYYEIGIL